MSRLMSVAFTEAAVRDRTKTVTRRKGWWKDKNGRRIIQPGDRITLCRKVMGRKKGEPLERIVDVEVVDVCREHLSNVTHFPAYGESEMCREGFPGLDPARFVHDFFVDAQGMDPDDLVTRIEWRYIEPGYES